MHLCKKIFPQLRMPQRCIDTTQFVRASSHLQDAQRNGGWRGGQRNRKTFEAAHSRILRQRFMGKELLCERHNAREPQYKFHCVHPVHDVARMAFCMLRAFPDMPDCMSSAHGKLDRVRPGTEPGGCEHDRALCSCWLLPLCRSSLTYDAHAHIPR